LGSATCHVLHSCSVADEASIAITSADKCVTKRHNHYVLPFKVAYANCEVVVPDWCSSTLARELGSLRNGLFVPLADKTDEDLLSRDPAGTASAGPGCLKSLAHQDYRTDSRKAAPVGTCGV
jgi:hypothetical protein